MPAFDKPDHAQTLLTHLLRHPECTKPQLCRIAGLPASTVHHVMAGLESAGLVTASGIADSAGGRRPAQYRINGELGSIIALSIRLEQMEAGLYDLAGKRLSFFSRDISCASLGPETYVSETVKSIEKLLSDAGEPRSKCLGVGVTVPGPVDFETGCVLQMSGAPLWKRFPLANRLREALRLPVAVDKDVYAVIQYLDGSGQMRNNRCTVYLSICEGIGAAVMISGQVFRGTHSLAGEIGHLTVRRDGIPCNCGNTGCLELYCSDIGIVQQYNAQTGFGLKRVDDVLAAMNAGDPTAAKVISQAIRYLVDTTSTIVMSYDPDELMIYCRWLSQQNSLYFQMLDALYTKSMFTQSHAVDIRLLGEKPMNLDAAFALARQRLVIDRCREIERFV